MAIYKYAVVPMIGWFVAGSLKFVINYIRFQRQAVNLIGNGGFPSTHTTVISSTVFLIGLSEGVSAPVFGLGMAVLMITIIDALGLRRAVGKQASAINRILPISSTQPLLRESQGHNPVEVLGGLIVGFIVAYSLNQL